MKLLKLLLFISIFTVGTFAQNAVLKGTVTDANGAIVAGATVTIIAETNPVKRNTATDKNGFFSISTTPGEYLVSASNAISGQSVYAKPQNTSLVAGKASTINLQLTETAVLRENVDVRISTGTAQPFSEVSKSVSVIDSDEIANRNETFLTDSVRTVPGFRVQQLGGFGRTTSIKTRGLRNQDTAILIDGQRLRDPASITGDASAFISDVSLVNVDRIEVLRGSGSSVYGTNAIGGVIDVQTARAGNGFTGQVLGEYGGLGFTRFSGKTGYGTRDGKYGFTAGFARSGVTRGIDGEDDADNRTFQTRIDAAPTSRLSFSGKLFVSDAFVRLNASPDTFGTLPPVGIIDARRGVNFAVDANDPDNLQRSDFFSGQINATYIINSKTFVSASYHGLKTKRENKNGGLGPGFQPFGGTQVSKFDGKAHTVGVKLDWAPVRYGRLVTGYEYELEKYDNVGVGPTAAGDFFARVDQSSNTFFAQYMQGFFDNRLQLAGGVRTQSFKLEKPSFSIANAPYAGLTLTSPPNAYTFDGAASYYFAESGTKVRAHVGNGYRVPSLYERFGSFFSSFSQSFTAIGDPLLQPEKSIAFDAGVDQNAFDDRVTLSATYFYTRLTDTVGYGNVVPDIGSTTRPFGGYENTKGGLARGAEFSGSFRPGVSTNLFASYTYTNSDQRNPQVSGSGIIQTLGIPENSFTFNATQYFGKRLSLNFDFEATSSYLAPIFSNTSFSTRIYRFGGNRRGDITAKYSLPVFNEKAKASFFATVENLFGYTYFENGFATAGRTARTGVSFEF